MQSAAIRSQVLAECFSCASRDAYLKNIKVLWTCGLSQSPPRLTSNYFPDTFPLNYYGLPNHVFQNSSTSLQRWHSRSRCHGGRGGAFLIRTGKNYNAIVSQVRDKQHQDFAVTTAKNAAALMTTVITFDGDSVEKRITTN